MYRKSLLFLIVVFWFLLWININHWYAESKVTQADMDLVVVRFCDDVWDMIFKKTIFVSTWWDNKVRFCIYNNWSKRIPITYGFNTATYNSVWTRVCMSKTDTADNDFTLIPKTKDRTIYVWSGEATMIEEDIVLPPGMSGLQMWCLTAELWLDNKIDIWWMFSLTVRKAFDLDIMIWSMADIKNSITILNTTWWIYSTNKKIKAQVDKENNLTLWFVIKNDGNVSQNIIITWKVYNVLGFEKEFTINANNIGPSSVNEFVANVGLLPAYKWLFSVKFYIQNDPQFAFDSWDENLTKSWYNLWQSQIFAFSRFVIIVIIVFIFILYRAFRRRKVIVEWSQSNINI